MRPLFALSSAMEQENFSGFKGLFVFRLTSNENSIGAY